MTMEPIATAIETLILRENALQVVGKTPPVVSFDPNIRPFMIKDKKAYISRMEKWISESTITKISAEDFNFIYPGLEIEKALQKILTMGPRLAIGTIGSKGALALLRRNDGSITRAEAPVIDVPVVDTIGAGDTFHGAFLAWLELKGKMSRASLASLTETELYDALFFANKAASLVCTRQGAEPPTYREVEALKLKKPENGKKNGAIKKASPNNKPIKIVAATGKTPAKSKPAAKTAAVKPKTAEKPKAAVKSKPAAKTAAAKPKTALKAKPAAKPKNAVKTKPAARPKTVVNTKTAAMQKTAVKTKSNVNSKKQMPVKKTKAVPKPKQAVKPKKK